MATFYLTFGFNTPLRNKYQKIKARDYDAARRLAIEAYGDGWAMIYTERAFAPMPKRYNITPRTRILGL